MSTENEQPQWADWFESLDSLPQDADTRTRARRGKEFEYLLVQMFDDAGLKPRSSYRPTGEEIDGSFVHRGRVMLFEAKWTKGTQPASALYAFRGKIEGKLVGTLGLFVSISGFSKDAINALIAGKTLNLLLMDGDDLRIISKGETSIVSALDYKLRAAAENGTPFVPLTGITGIENDEEVPVTQPQSNKTFLSTIVISEGNFDQFTLTALTSLRRPGIEDTTFFAAGGRANLSLVAQTITDNLPDTKRVVIVADGDGDPDSVRKDLTRRTLPLTAQSAAVDIVVLEPNLETVFGLIKSDTGRRFQSTGGDRKHILKRLHKIDLSELADSNQDVRHLLDLLHIPTDD